ncbi:HSCB C-terminal oligomerization domain-containing protein [Fimicolochytrium jonesii]|uniref:HSCB C-terminal oligomerization domain-containing protein n=1 Tax=Fimicolochytrium jonesii TaxID=1396493 RepID=UPI0022FE38B3|nr:HSCB C-terminal oligomerization domain-containing protein [Fimicolochytrium jonesii]KAI8817225.1 HSCB C-terminal oligomerization domain-containing protein [Fimicolochytrium jonesii]
MNRLTPSLRHIRLVAPRPITPISTRLCPPRSLGTVAGCRGFACGVGMQRDVILSLHIRSNAHSNGDGGARRIPTRGLASSPGTQSSDPSPSRSPDPASVTPDDRMVIQPIGADATYLDVFFPEGADEVGGREARKWRFDVDEAGLKKRFLELQRVVHPDGFAGKSKTERLCAAQQSTFINKAYQTLRDPLARAKYLLSLHGIAVDSEAAGSEPQIDDPEVLMAVMEAREEIEEARGEDELRGIQAENEERIKTTLREIEAAFAKRDLNAAAQATTRLRYWRNIRTAIEEWTPGGRVEIRH